MYVFEEEPNVDSLSYAEEVVSRCDTGFKMGWDETLALYARLGFKEILSETYTSPNSDGGEDRVEDFKVFWSEEGLLLSSASYTGFRKNPTTGEWDIPHKGVNSSSVYYNWVPNDPRSCSDLLSSGSFHVFRGGDRMGFGSRGGTRIDFGAPTQEGDFWVWTGDHDATANLVHNLGRLRENGTFLAEWEVQPHFWLVTPEDMKRSDDLNHPKGFYDKVLEARIKRFPQGVRRSICAESD